MEAGRARDESRGRHATIQRWPGRPSWHDHRLPTRMPLPGRMSPPSIPDTPHLPGSRHSPSLRLQSRSDVRERARSAEAERDSRRARASAIKLPQGACAGRAQRRLHAFEPATCAQHPLAWHGLGVLEGMQERSAVLEGPRRLDLQRSAQLFAPRKSPDSRGTAETGSRRRCAGDATHRSPSGRRNDPEGDRASGRAGSHDDHEHRPADHDAHLAAHARADPRCEPAGLGRAIRAWRTSADERHRSLDRWDAAAFDRRNE